LAHSRFIEKKARVSFHVSRGSRAPEKIDVQTKGEKSEGIVNERSHTQNTIKLPLGGVVTKKKRRSRRMGKMTKRSQQKGSENDCNQKGKKLHDEEESLERPIRGKCDLRK